jgi:uncharacterized alkaline shock family protein YloU
VALFNRLLIILLALVVLVTAIAALLTTVGVIQPVQLAVAGSWFVDRLLPFSQLDPTTGTLTIGVCLLLIVLAVLLLVLELRPGPRQARRITLKDDELGRVTVALDGLRALADREASRVEGVVKARSQVEQEPPGLRIACRVSVDPASSVPDMTQTLRERLKTAVEHHVGLKVSQVSVDAQVAPLATNQRHRRVE